MIIATPSGSIKEGGLCPQSEALPPLTPSQRKKGQNQLFLAIFLIFAPQNRILPPRCPPQKKKKKKKKKKKSGAATGHTIWWINRIPNVFLVVVL